MKRLVYGGLLMAAGMATAGCGGRAGHTLSVPIDSDTIVLVGPDMPQEFAIDSDSIGEVTPLPPDSLTRPQGGPRPDHPMGPPPDGQRPPQMPDGKQPPRMPDGKEPPQMPDGQRPPQRPDGQHGDRPQGPPPHDKDGNMPPPPPEGAPGHDANS